MVVTIRIQDVKKFHFSWMLVCKTINDGLWLKINFPMYMQQGTSIQPSSNHCTSKIRFKLRSVDIMCSQVHVVTGIVARICKAFYEGEVKKGSLEECFQTCANALPTE